MPARRPTAQQDAAAAAGRQGLPAHGGNPLPHFLHDLRETGLGRQRVADQGRLHALLQGALDHEAEAVLVPHLPVAPVDEQQGGRTGRAVEVIQPLARARAIGHVQIGGVLLHHGQAARFKRRQLLGTAGHGAGVVVGRVAHGLGQVEQGVNHHQAALASWATWLLSSSVSSWRTRLNSGAVMWRGRSSGMR